MPSGSVNSRKEEYVEFRQEEAWQCAMLHSRTTAGFLWTESPLSNDDSSQDLPGDAVKSGVVVGTV